MGYLRLVAAATLLAASPLWATPDAVPVAATAPAPVYAEIAALVVSDDHTDAKVDGLIAATLQAMVEADGDIAAMDKEYPGLIRAVGDAMRPVMMRGVVESLPGYRADLAAMYAANLSAAEAREFADFLAEPGSRAFFGAAVRRVNYQSIANDVVAERDISATSLSRDVRNAAAKVAAEATPEQVKRVEAFFTAPLGRKLLALRDRKSAVDLKWANMEMPALEQEMELVVIETMVSHVGKTDPELAKGMREALAKERTDKKTAS